jgi:hypothetical protein
MKTWIYEFGNFAQSIKGDLTWGCTCQHGSIGRFRKGNNFPCFHVILALNAWTNELLLEKNAKRKSVVKG